MGTGVTELRKTITVWQGTALAVSMVIGSGLLGLPGIALSEGGVSATAVGWMLTALAAVPLIAIFSTLGLRFTTAAGLSQYAEAAAGRWARYAVAVVMVGSFPVGIPALAIIGGSYAQRLFDAPEWTVGWLAAGILTLVTAANLAGVRVAGYVNSASVVALVLVVAGTALARGADLGHGVGVTAQAATGGGELNYLAVWTVCALLFWAYLGWENLSFGLEEFREPSRTIPRVYWASFALVVVLYLVLGLTTVGAQDRGLDLTGPSGLVTLVDQTPVGLLLVVVMVLVVLANANAWVFGASRLVSLLALLAAYLAVIAIATAGNVSVTRLILIVSQNLIVLYAFSIVAYWKTASGGPRRAVVTAAAAVSWAFLLSGFSWWIAYALLLLLIGWLRYRRHRAADREPAGEPVPEPAGVSEQAREVVR
jgi:amino acid transporter